MRPGIAMGLATTSVQSVGCGYSKGIIYMNHVNAKVANLKRTRLDSSPRTPVNEKNSPPEPLETHRITSHDTISYLLRGLGVSQISTPEEPLSMKITIGEKECQVLVSWLP